MKNNTLIASGFLLLLISCSRNNGFLNISRRIYQNSKAYGTDSIINVDSLFEIARMEAYNKASFLKGNLADTLFFLEGYQIDTREITGTIWDSKNKVDYKYYGGKANFTDASSFTKYQLSLVSKWDTIQIRKEEAKSGTLFDGRTLKATRYLINDGKFKIDEIKFNDFFDPKRDLDERKME